MAIKVNARKNSLLSRLFKKKYVLVVGLMAVGIPEVRVSKFNDLDEVKFSLDLRYDLDSYEIASLLSRGRIKKFYQESQTTYQFNLVEVSWSAWK